MEAKSLEMELKKLDNKIEPLKTIILSQDAGRSSADNPPIIMQKPSAHGGCLTNDCRVGAVLIVVALLYYYSICYICNLAPANLEKGMSRTIILLLPLLSSYFQTIFKENQRCFLSDYQPF